MWDGVHDVCHAVVDLTIAMCLLRVQCHVCKISTVWFVGVCVQYLICVLPGVQSVQNMFFVQCVFFVHDVCCSATLAPINIPSSGLDTARHLHLHLLPHHLRQHQHHLDLDLDLDHVLPHHLHQLHYHLFLDLKRTVLNSNACL